MSKIKPLYKKTWRHKWHEIIFGTETRAGKVFDELLLASILASVLIVFLDSVTSLNQKFGDLFYIAEWIFTIFFTIEYILRIITTPRPSRYIFSFYGIIDLLAILPTYLSIFLVGTQFLITIRILRLLRIFRILKLTRYVGASADLWDSLRSSRHKIAVFLWTVMTIVVIMGSIMYLIEGPDHGFRSIPESIYWAIVTLTTVGYGDISPETPLGKAIASIIMIIGYAIIAVPTGIISVEMSKVRNRLDDENECTSCHYIDHDEDAKFCKKCGKKLPKRRK
jgi:voltage-gated potassium channel